MKLKPLPAIKIIKILEKIGFRAVRRSGSHVILKHNDGRLTLVPVHLK
jgi:predicted RNA binding protein YcfA (HicA-like mRNA interferase family)